MRLTDFAGVTLPGNNESNDTPIELRNNLVELRDGAYDQDGNDTAARPVQLSRAITVLLRCRDEDLDNLIHALTQGRRILRGVLDDGVTYRQTFAKVISISRPYALASEGVQALAVTFQQDYPYWMASDDEPKYLDNGLLLTGWKLSGHHDDATITTTTTALTISNTGQERVPRGQILLTPAAAGSVSNIKIENAANQMWFRYTGTVAYPHFLEIDLLTKTVKWDAIGRYNCISTPTDQMDWMLLERGTNAITITCTAVAGSTAFEWHWSRHYR